MKSLFFSVLSLALLCVMQTSTTTAADGGKQFYEIRSYILGEEGDADAIDQYLSNALVPALNRNGISNVGVLTNAANDQSGSPRIVVAIPYDSADQMVAVKKKIDADEQYQKDAADYLALTKGPYQRIQSELISAMDCWPALKVADGSLENDERVYELRIYESPNERLGHLKVEMFNNGEVPIFLASGISPVFIGQAVVGPNTPNLTYLTTYPSEDARLKAWETFRAHPDWQVLKKVKKYKGSVSKNHTYNMVPKPYSQM